MCVCVCVLGRRLVRERGSSTVADPAPPAPWLHPARTNGVAPSAPPRPHTHRLRPPAPGPHHTPGRSRRERCHSAGPRPPPPPRRGAYMRDPLLRALVHCPEVSGDSGAGGAGRAAAGPRHLLGGRREAESAASASLLLRGPDVMTRFEAPPGPRRRPPAGARGRGAQDPGIALNAPRGTRNDLHPPHGGPGTAATPTPITPRSRRSTDESLAKRRRRPLGPVPAARGMRAGWVR